MSEKGRNIILRVGSRTIECGYEGIHKPLVSLDVHHFSEPQNFKVSTTDKKTIREITHFKTLFYPNTLIYENQDGFIKELHIHLTKLLNQVFYKAGISTINAKLLLISNTTTSEFYVKVISNLLIQRFLMRAVVVLSTPLMISIASGSSSAIVVDFGWEYTNVDVIFDSRILQNYSKFTIRSGRRLHYETLERLKHLNFDTSLISFKDIEKTFVNIKDIDLSLNELIICGPYRISRKLLVSIFSDVLIKMDERDDDHERSLPQLIAELIEKDLPIDLRKCLADRLIFTGGISQIKGIDEMIINSLNTKLRVNCNKISSLGSFPGASLYSTMNRHLKKHQKLWEFRK